MTVELLNIDCMEYMATLEDNAFDLAIVDPPYGLGSKITSGGTWSRKYKEKDHVWDVAPGKLYFAELFRCSNNQLIWGGNYFSLPRNRDFVIWRKLSISESFSMAMAEYCWSSFDRNAKVFEHIPEKGNRFHPTQKPVKLYKWLLQNYAKPGQRILDTHLGSGSSAIAAHYYGCDFVGCELDKDYYDAACKRFDKETRQETLFQKGTV
jgi:site-specific DNA-methyltransferase (adenine-specific)